MVDVGHKKVTKRTARARGEVTLSRGAFAALSEGRLAKGDALAIARIAGIQAAKKTSEIVPLCHSLSPDSISVELTLDEASTRVVVIASVSIRARTGIEMEALVAVSAACLSLYDMVKGIDRSAVIREIRLLEKTGGRSGRYSSGGTGERRR
jgi:cyclic pyranopterin monophosphate synthase